MLSPLIPDDKHPKWIIVLKILEIIGSPRARKIAVRLKIYDVDNFLLAIKIIILSNLFERYISGIVSEINQNLELKKILDFDLAYADTGLNSHVNIFNLYGPYSSYFCSICSPDRNLPHFLSIFAFF